VRPGRSFCCRKREFGFQPVRKVPPTSTAFGVNLGSRQRLCPCAPTPF
jgi:hypothetical protein